VNRRSISSTFAIALFGAALFVGSAGPAAASTLPILTQPVDENQVFRGLVNGSTGAGNPAIIRMACFGPITPERFTGHPFAGQTVEVVRVPHLLPGFPDVGLTGANADSIQVDFDGAMSDGSDPSLTLTEYNVKVEIPTSLELPCDGRGTVNFIPAPAGEFERVASVPVEFVGQP